jgi:hypothetical protein
MDKMAALQRKFIKMGLLAGTTSSFIARIEAKEDQDELHKHRDDSIHIVDENEDDEGPVMGEPSGALSDVKLATKCGELDSVFSA